MFVLCSDEIPLQLNVWDFFFYLGQYHTRVVLWKDLYMVWKQTNAEFWCWHAPFLWVFVCFLVSSRSGSYLLEINIQSTFWQGTVMQDKIQSIGTITLIRSPCRRSCHVRQTWQNMFVSCHCCYNALASIFQLWCPIHLTGKMAFFNCVENFHSLGHKQIF